MRRPDPRPRRPGPCLALGAFATLVTGCGYTYGLEAGAKPGAETIAVLVVDNQSFRQRLEQPLDSAIYRALAQHSALVPDVVGRADLILRTTIQAIDGQTIVRGGVAPVREGGLLYSANVELLDGATGEVLRERTVVDRAEFRIPVDETERSANLEAAADLARKIVLALEADI